ncbi:ATP-dependent transcriptional regulator [Hartmannibacter diazotrophicus]|uniref:ATP-dependent transcriptional regulator n=1 Tax=Hartmannibacter diazotrophicus TaxID=1482074 RepID=A0A2C9DAH2_9HYPH|nr:helix-turn-helix domain-containing protein [Hartmannibacter diazotrophicus]SON56741.1 ATP-dependent transcriptional regulator [Hartmannibacter diazotrophicus]
MDSLITAAARALAAGDAFSALKRVALREDAPALALRGTAMAQLGDLARARELFRKAARAFGATEPLARARCQLGEAEIALVSRDLVQALERLDDAFATLEALGDRRNAAHAAYLLARAHLLIGKLEKADRMLARIDFDMLPLPSQAGSFLVIAGIARRRIRTQEAKAALGQAMAAAGKAGIASLSAEVDLASRALDAPAARLVAGGSERLVRLGDVEALFASGAFVVDACRTTVRCGQAVVPLAGRQVLFALARALAEAWPHDVSREALLVRAFGARQADESHRARLRVEIGRLRKALAPFAGLKATKRGFLLEPLGEGDVVVLAPPADDDHAAVLALLGDGEAWSSSALALALGVSARTVQRSLDALTAGGKVESFGRGRACRWIAASVPGFPTSLLLPGPVPGG